MKKPKASKQAKKMMPKNDTNWLVEKTMKHGVMKPKRQGKKK